MESRPRILVVDDDPIVAASCERILGDTYEVRVCATGRAGVEALTSDGFDLALIDLKLPDMDGMDILRQAPDAFADVPLIVVTGYSTIATAVEAIKRGAMDYVAKPFSPDELQAAVQKALRHGRLLAEYRHLHEEVAGPYKLCRLVGDSPAMRRVFSLIEQVAPTDSTVLITGESGVGKDLVARAIHFAGPRREAPFVAVDCGAVPPSLIDSELFGHVRGAFTGAASGSLGLFRQAHRGTLFLDEVTSLPLDCQATILRVIEDREVRPVSASAADKVDVRFIAATNQDLGRLVQEGRFRHDLFYRLNVFPINLPPLRERAEDVPRLARHFLAVFSSRMHKRLSDFTEEALAALQAYPWPGNVRELSNVVERVVILASEGAVGASHLRECLAASSPAASSAPRTAEDLRRAKESLRERAVADIERVFLLDALRRNDYNITRAAEETGMPRPNFHALLRKHGLRLRDIARRDGP